MNRVHVGLIGSGFVSTLHAEALQRCPAAELAAVASPTPGKAEAFAAKFGIAVPESAAEPLSTIAELANQIKAPN